MSYFRIIKRSTLSVFCAEHNAAKKPIELWYHEIKDKEFKNFSDLKAVYKNASLVANNRVVFNIKGNDYRLLVKMNFFTRQIFIIWFGTHKQYDNINVTTINYKK